MLLDVFVAQKHYAELFLGYFCVTFADYVVMLNYSRKTI